jgi:Domain of unknown function (DUF4326)
MTETKLMIESRAVAKVSRKPELRHTGSGFPVCRFTVATDEGPAKSPVIMPVYAFGGPEEVKRRLALRCGRLRVGELVEVRGHERQALRQTKGAVAKRWRENTLEAIEMEVLGADGQPLQRSEEDERQLRGLVVHCERSPYEVYVGRGHDPFTGQRGEWGNKYSHRPSKYEVVYVATAEEAVACYKAELWERIKSGELSLERLATLAGKTLGCWCFSSCCHGEVLASASVWAVDELARRRAAR